MAIKYQKGTDKKNRAVFVCGKATVPAAMVSRVLNTIEGMSESMKNRTFIAKLMPKHGDFFEAMEKAGISEQKAIEVMASLAPAKEKATPRLSKEAAAVAKMLCRKYAKMTPDAMFAAFAETMNRPEFKVLVIELVSEFEEKFRRNPQDRIRVRPERKDLVDRAKKAREGKGKK